MNTNVAQSPLTLQNARVVLPDRIMEHGTVVVESGRIVSVAEAGTPKGEVVDLAGAVLLPGFIDVHIHGAVGVDVMEATAGELLELSEYLATQGVTGWLPTLVPGSDENYARVAAAVSEAVRASGGAVRSSGEAARSSSEAVRSSSEAVSVSSAEGFSSQGVSGSSPVVPAAARVGARILGLHYEGPFVNSAQCGALHVEHFKTYAGPADLNSLPVSDEMARMITLAPEIEGGVELVRELTRRGWVVSIGHTRASIERLDQALSAGARHMTHFMNAMSPLHHRTPGPIAWGLSHDDVTVDMIADGIHLDPFMLNLLVKIKGTRGISLISDAIAAAGKGDGDYAIWGETISVKGRRTSNVSGSIAGSVITMLDAVRTMRSLGLSDVEIARMASTNPALLLGLDDECGSIEPGKRADLVALDASGNVLLTLIAGHRVNAGR